MNGWKETSPLKPLAKSLTFHLLAPYAVHLALLFLIIHSLSGSELIGILLFGGWIALLGIGLISIPFGVAHVLQAIYLTPSWPSRTTQFWVGLLNPSFAAITLTGLLLIAPGLFF